MPTTHLKEELKKIYLFRELSDEKLTRLSQISYVKSFTEENYIFYEGEISHHILILTKGNVKIVKHDKKGNEIIIGDFHPYALLAEAATLRETPLPSTAQAKSDCSIIKIDLKAFQEEFLSDGIVARHIIHSLLDKVQLLQQNIEFNLAGNAKEKVISFYAHKNSMNTNLQQFEIAAILGITPETLCRVTKDLVNENILDKNEAGDICMQEVHKDKLKPI